MIERRAFVAGISASAMLSCRRGAAAQLGRLPVIGLLSLADPNPERPWSVLRQALEELGYRGDRRIRFEVRNVGGADGSLGLAARELVAAGVDVIVAYLTPAVAAAKAATDTVPIVMSSADPVGMGFAESLARPGGNITGMSGVLAETIGKNLELVRECLPDAPRAGILFNTADPLTPRLREQFRTSSPPIGFEILERAVNGADELEPALTGLVDAGAAAVVVQPSLPRRRIAEIALRLRLPTVCPITPFAREGGLLSYASDSDRLMLRLASYIDRILKGAKPAELPIEQPTHFTLSVNMRTAAALGLTIPPAILIRADEVIE